MDNDDKALISQALEGDDDSFGLLIERYLKPIYRFAYGFVGNSHDAEDITQEVFVKVWKNLKRFDPTRTFKPWIYNIAKNTALDFLKKKKPLSFAEFETEEGDNLLLEIMPDESPLPDELMERQDLASVLNSALQQLGPKYSTILTLYFYEHFTLQEIADSLEESINTIKSRHRRGLIMLRKLLPTY